MDTLKEQLRKVIEDSLDIQDVSRSLHDDCINLRTKLLQSGNEYASRGTDGISKRVPDGDTPRGTRVLVGSCDVPAMFVGIDPDSCAEPYIVLCDIDYEITEWETCTIID